MRRWFGLTLGLMLAAAGVAWGSEAGFPEFEDQTLFRPKFLQQAHAAEKPESPGPSLEAFYQTLTNPAERAEIELRIARVYNQRTEHVNFEKAVLWYDKALVRPLPLQTQAMLLILRGNSHEALKHRDAALRDYIRGLLICLHFRLPDHVFDEQGGKLPTPALNDGVFDESDAAEAARQQENRQIWADYRRESEINRQEQGLLMQKWYYIEAIKRVLGDGKVKDEEFRELVARLSNRNDRIEEVLQLAKAPNPRPVRKGEEAAER